MLNPIITQALNIDAGDVVMWLVGLVISLSMTFLSYRLGSKLSKVEFQAWQLKRAEENELKRKEMQKSFDEFRASIEKELDAHETARRAQDGQMIEYKIRLATVEKALSGDGVRKP